MPISHPLHAETIQSAQRCEMIDITARIQALIDRRKIQDAMVIVHVLHTTAAITINENADPNVKIDMLEKLERLIPQDETYYLHDEGNSDSHLKASLVGNSVTLLVDHGKLQLGRWQGIHFCEFDGPRERRVVVKVVELDK